MEEWGNTRGHGQAGACLSELSALLVTRQGGRAYCCCLRGGGGRRGGLALLLCLHLGLLLLRI